MLVYIVQHNRIIDTLEIAQVIPVYDKSQNLVDPSFIGDDILNVDVDEPLPEQKKFESSVIVLKDKTRLPMPETVKQIWELVRH